ncbi:MAG: Gfo/Idh/MocA family protein [Lachnospira sp.]
MIRFAVIGSGWRSLFYVRIAKALPDMFELTALLCRGQEKADRIQKDYGIHTTTSEDEIIASKPDFVVSAVNKSSMSDVVRYWAAKGIPVLSETPAGLDIDTLKAIRQDVEKGARIQVAEQYFLYPSIKAIIDECKSGTIGEPVSLTISAMHDYHAASVIRRMLGTGLEDVAITGKTFSMKVTDTRTRYEVLTEGRVVEKEEKHLVMEYADGKTAFYDFMSDQYRSPIRNRYINLRGTRGEIINDTVCYLDKDNLAGCKKLDITNPYGYAGLSEDEAAITGILLGMKEYVDTGKEVYPMDEALYDAYMGILMCEAGKPGYKQVKGSFGDI